MNDILIKVGDRYGDYTLIQRYDIKELKLIMNVIEHIPTKAKILHLDNDDPENLFCLSFQTLPTSSNGVAHILEHTVLCGSQKFPVKDPFFTMQKRSLNTFMNAFTGSDFTCYPASSLNRKDFYNLLEVYADAVFHPLLLENSFYQEGHRLEFAKLDDSSSPLEIKGIVYNEMKGSMASSDSRLWHEMLKHLTPDLPYAYNSGGDPKEIVTLTYQQLKKFHETHYNPSSCLFYFYGNFALKGHLDFLQKQVFDHHGQAHTLHPLTRQKPFNTPKQIKMTIPAPKAEDLSEENVIGVGFLTAHISEQLDVLALTLLDSYLMDTDNSRLKKAVLESKLCDAFESYLDPEMSEVPYVFYFRGVKLEDHKKIKHLLRKTLEDLAHEGISKKDLEASLHQLELSRTEIGGEGQPFGLTLFMRSALAFQHGVSPEKGLVVQALFKELDSLLDDPFFMSSIIRKYLLDNPTSVDILAEASATLLEEETAQEKAALDKLQASLTPEQKQLLVVKAKDLKLFQDDQKNQNIECLPKIHLSDVDETIKSYPLTSISQGLWGFEGFTNGMIYADAVLSLEHLSEQELCLAPLLAALVTEVGLKDDTYETTLDTMHAFTGGLSASLSLYSSAQDPNSVKPALMIKGKALKRYSEPFFQLLYKMVYHPRFDEIERLEELVAQLYSIMQNRLSKQALRYASQQALSKLSKTGALSHLFYGLPFYEKIKELKSGGRPAIEKLSIDLKALYKKWQTKPLCELVIVTDKNELETHMPIVKTLFSHLMPFQAPSKAEMFEVEYLHQAHVIPSQVAFNVKAMKVPGLNHPHSAPLMIASSLLENLYLHNQVREIGGAYGVGATYSPINSIFYFHSYRDPHIAKTFSAFDESLDKLCQGHVNLQELEEAKICIIQMLDSPMTPIAKAITSYGYLKEDRTPAMRQAFRTKLIKSSLGDIIEAASQHLKPSMSASYVSFTGLDLLKKEENLLKKLKVPLAVIPL